MKRFPTLCVLAAFVTVLISTGKHLIAQDIPCEAAPVQPSKYDFKRKPQKQVDCDWRTQYSPQHVVQSRRVLEYSSFELRLTATHHRRIL
jgi:hypothetical protein